MPMHTSTASLSTLCHNKLRLTGISSSKLHFPEQLPLRIKANLLDTNAVRLTLTMCCFGITSGSSPLHSRVDVPPRVITIIPTTYGSNPGAATTPIIVEPYTRRTMVSAPHHSPLPHHASLNGLPGLSLHHGSRMHHGGGFGDFGGFGGGHGAPFLISNYPYHLSQILCCKLL
ncbi:hypothetical protein OCU04_002194 [Sclerotinia nivalis]|uniref:Uncharacterized protein n=1 Tax=Sclerotinia nivalis TaxID=352851 RepID=A0A9X0AZM8_9HELO|nr:hypothetical protein OCU04_002194 [Sclerotinia nivalis]